MHFKQTRFDSLLKSLAAWVQAHLGDIAHERRVHTTAIRLFNLTRPLHSLPTKHRKLLRLATIVHDVGRCRGEKDHPTDGEKMIKLERTIALSGWQRRALRYLTRYHRGAVPKIGFDGILRPGDGRRALRIVLALLRAADTLDSRQLQPPRLAFTLDRGKLRITCDTERNLERAKRTFTRRKKYRLLEDVLDCDVQVRVRELRLAA